jgi:hypothetical protein
MNRIDTAFLINRLTLPELKSIVENEPKHVPKKIVLPPHESAFLTGKPRVSKDAEATLNGQAEVLGVAPEDLVVRVDHLLEKALQKPSYGEAKSPWRSTAPRAHWDACYEAELKLTKPERVNGTLEVCVNDQEIQVRLCGTLNQSGRETFCLVKHADGQIYATESGGDGNRFFVRACEEVLRGLPKVVVDRLGSDLLRVPPSPIEAVRQAWYSQPEGPWQKDGKTYKRKDRAGVEMEVSVRDDGVSVSFGHESWSSDGFLPGIPPPAIRARFEWFRELPDSIRLGGRPLNSYADDFPAS